MPFCKALFFIPLVAPILPFTASLKNIPSNPKPNLSTDCVGSTPKPTFNTPKPNGEKAPLENLLNASLIGVPVAFKTPAVPALVKPVYVVSGFFSANVLSSFLTPMLESRPAVSG